MKSRPEKDLSGGDELRVAVAARRKAARARAEGPAMEKFWAMLETRDLKWPNEMPAAAPKPVRCARFARERLAESLPVLCQYLIAKTLDGDLMSLKMLWQMAELDSKASAPAAAKAVANARAASLAFARKTVAEYKAR